MITLILISTLAIGILGIICGALLGYAGQKLKVEVDERVKEIEEILPGANCGACGYPGCSGYAKAIVDGKAPINLCSPGGVEVQEKIGKIMGIEVSEASQPPVAHVKCSGDNKTVKKIADYKGIMTCNAIHLTTGGDKACVYGCLGYGDCEAACPFDAIHIEEDGLPHVIEEKCTGCGLCAEACPRDIIEMVPRDAKIFVNCVSYDFGPDVSKVCKKGCIGCSLCVRLTNDGSMEMIDNLAVVHFDKEFTKDKTVADKCPTKVIEFRGIEKNKPENDETEVVDKNS